MVPGEPGVAQRKTQDVLVTQVLEHPRAGLSDFLGPAQRVVASSRQRCEQLAHVGEALDLLAVVVGRDAPCAQAEDIDRQRIAGLFAFTPVRIRLRGEPVAARHGHHLAIRPEHRGGVVFTALSRHAFEVEASHGTRLVIG